MDEYPILNKFCYTAEELHEEYGLSLEGKVARDLSDYDLPDDQWLTIFQHRYIRRMQRSTFTICSLLSLMITDFFSIRCTRVPHHVCTY